MTRVRSTSGTVSPIGSTAAQSAARRAIHGKAYRSERQRLEPYEALARIVIAYRVRLELTQKELADRMKTSHSAISRIESGKYPTTPETLRRLAAALGLRFVMGFEDPAEPEKTRQLIAM